MSDTPKKKNTVSYDKEARTFANKTRRLERHLRAHQRDVPAYEAMKALEKRGSLKSVRSAPHNKRVEWTRELRTLAQQHRLCGYNGNQVFKFGTKDSIYAGMKEYHKRDLELVKKKASQPNKKESKKTEKVSVDLLRSLVKPKKK